MFNTATPGTGYQRDKSVSGKRSIVTPLVSSLSGESGATHVVIISTRHPAATNTTANFSAWRSAPPTRGRNWGQNINTEGFIFVYVVFKTTKSTAVFLIRLVQGRARSVDA